MKKIVISLLMVISSVSAAEEMIDGLDQGVRSMAGEGGMYGLNNSIPYNQLNGKTLPFDQLIVTGIPMSQAIMNRDFTASHSMKCDNKIVNPVQQYVAGRYRDNSYTETYDFSKLKKPLNCIFSVTTRETFFGQKSSAKPSTQTYAFKIVRENVAN